MLTSHHVKSSAMSAGATAPRSPWLVGPAFDLLFLANCGWPLVVALTVLTADALPESGVLADPVMTLSVYYLLTTPHRWITLAMVFLDGERFWKRPRAFLGVAIAFALLIGTVWLSTQTLVLLLLVDFAWNAWHYASQHSGISRIYGRAAWPGVNTGTVFEKAALRIFILYAIVRPLVYPVFVMEEVSSWPGWVQGAHAAFVDATVGLVRTVQDVELVLLVLPAMLLVNELRRFRPSAFGRLVYLANVCLLYGSIVVAVHLQIDSRVVLGLLLATSIFHATEYLAIVSWSVWKKHGGTSETLFGHLVPRWGMAMLAFMAILAVTGWMLDVNLRLWVLVTILVSYLHYAYDGMIWKVRRPASAAVA